MGRRRGVSAGPSEMCFSPESDLAAGVVVVAIGVDACRHLRDKEEYVCVAVLAIRERWHVRSSPSRLGPRSREF